MKLRILLVLLAFCVTTTAQTPQNDKALIDDLVLANRMLASQELGVLDAFGHVSVRSKTNPNHFYIARYVAPGIVTVSDIIENDLDSQPVNGARNDQYQERFLHGEIYKARPDVMAVVHSHTPELVAFGVSSVALRTGDDDQPVPVYDIRKDNNGRSGIIDTPAKAKSMAQALGKSNSLLLLGHGAVVVSNSVYGVVSGASGLRGSAKMQEMLIAMGGTFDLNPRRPAPGTQRAPRAAVVPSGTGGGAGGDRGWEYWKQLVTPLISGPDRIPRPAAAMSAEQEAINDLVLANRMLASREFGILGSTGHVSMRSKANPNHYFISRYVSAGIVKASDIIENDLDSKPVNGPRNDEYQEVYMHGEILKARPDVMAVLHAHTPEILAFTESSVSLRPVVNGGTFIGDGLPMHDVRKFDPRENIIRTPELGKTVATVLGNAPGVLLKGHGIALTGSSIPDLVSKAYNLRMNAIIQQQAIALGGKVTYLDHQPPAPAAASQPASANGGYNRAWEYWKQIFRVKEN
jgi:ribulose-5-phosphate 4-epimerase/fuculose-1-phosphate aldolase